MWGRHENNINQASIPVLVLSFGVLLLSSPSPLQVPKKRTGAYTKISHLYSHKIAVCPFHPQLKLLLVCTLHYSCLYIFIQHVSERFETFILLICQSSKYYTRPRFGMVLNGLQDLAFIWSRPAHCPWSEVRVLKLLSVTSWVVQP